MNREGVEPVGGTRPASRAKLDLKGELALALLPTLTVLGMLGLVEAFSHHRLLFTSLASSALLIYLDPRNEMNAARTLILAHLGATGVGLLADAIFGTGYLAAGSAMALVIFLMILLDAVHPPAVATSLTFTFQPGAEGALAPFALALGSVVVLISLQHSVLWLLNTLRRR